jgi:serine/threonine-protein kinase
MTGAADDAPPDGGLSEGSEPDRPILALVMAYQRRAWRRGERTRVEAYLAQQPMLREDAEAVLDLIYQEVMLREQAGESPRLEEYTSRFPHLAPQLALQFELEEAFGQSTPTPSMDGVTLGNRTSPAPAILPTVPGYEILSVLGRGGMGVVYKVRQLRLNRVSALKMILAGDHAEPEVAMRFLAEAEAVAKVNHPHIVQVFTCGDHDGRPYIEMECVDGGSLADRLDGTPWPARAAAPLIETVARAIHEAHRLGIVYRDLKPANVLLAPDGTPPPARLTSRRRALPCGWSPTAGGPIATPAASGSGRWPAARPAACSGRNGPWSRARARRPAPPVSGGSTWIKGADSWRRPGATASASGTSRPPGKSRISRWPGTGPSCSTPGAAA